MRKYYPVILFTISSFFFFVASCDDSGSISDPQYRAEYQEQYWKRIPPPPDAPPGTVCWLWSRGYADNAYGGPACYVPCKEGR